MYGKAADVFCGISSLYKNLSPKCWNWATLATTPMKIAFLEALFVRN
jgi:hypothetical protein